MSREYDQFLKHIEATANLSSVYEYLGKSSPQLNADYILRSEIVFIISAFDNYLHSIVINKAVDRFISNRELSKDIKLPIQRVNSMLNASNSIDRSGILKSSLKEILSKESFQSHRNIEKALGYINIKKFWKEIALNMGMPSNDLKYKLDVFVFRRNKIAHEADFDEASLQPASINLEYVKDCRDFIMCLAQNIDSIVLSQ